MIANPRQTEDIFDMLIRSYNDLTRSETKVADYILRNKQLIHSQSISELASACNVSEATISRFCHSVGCSSFNEFKLATVHAISSSEPTIVDADLYSTVQASDSIEQKCRKLYNVSTDALQKTLNELDPQTIAEVARVLSDSTRVFCFGQGNSSIVAEDAWGRFACVSPKFHFIANANLQSTTVELLGEGDVVLYFSFSGAVRELIEIGKVMKKSKAKLILVTRFPNSPGAAFADHLLICGANEAPRQQGSIAAKIGQLFIVDILFHEFCALNEISSIFPEFND